jgi:hypothetical protein
MDRQECLSPQRGCGRSRRALAIAAATGFTRWESKSRAMRIEPGDSHALRPALEEPGGDAVLSSRTTLVPDCQELHQNPIAFKLVFQPAS